MGTYTARTERPEEIDTSEEDEAWRERVFPDMESLAEDPQRDRPQSPAPGLISLSDLSVSESEEQGKPFPTDLLPDIGRELVLAYRNRTKGETPDSIAAMAIIGTLSAAIGRGLQHEGLDGLPSSASLYVLGGACSSSGKSMILDQVFKPLENIGMDARERFDRLERPRIQYKLETLTQKKTKTEEDIQAIAEHERQLGRKPRLSCEDTTTPAMVRIIANQDNESLSSISDEARDPIKNLLGKHTNGKTDEGFITKAWSGKQYQCDRSTDKFDGCIRAPWLSILWFTQPDLLNEIALNPDLLHSGCFSRFLISDTKAIPALPTGERVPELLLGRWGGLLRELHDTFRAADGVTIIQPTPRARALFEAYAGECIDRMNGDLSEVQTIAGKWSENATRIALIFHAAEHGAKAVSHDLSEATAQSAIDVMRWFAIEALAVVHAGISSRRFKRAEHLAQIIERHSWDGSGLSLGILKNNHNFEAPEIERLCMEFPRKLKLIEVPATARGGRPSRRCNLA